MTIRIMHVVEAFGFGGGVETGIANLIERLDPNRFEHVLCGIFQVGPQTDRYPMDRVPLVCLEEKRTRGRSQMGPLLRKIREIKPDIVHSRNWGAIESVFAARWAGFRAVHSEHGVEKHENREPLRRRGLRKVAYAAADRVFAVSHELRDSLVARCGSVARRIDVIHNGVDTRQYRRDRAARQRFRAELGIHDHEFVIGCVGRMSPVKDHATMLRATEIFGRSSQRWRLLLAGDGPERAKLENQVACSDVLRGRVTFLGTTDNVAELLNALDVYVLPSIIEGISNSLLEAMATGVPVVATRTGGTPEVVGTQQSGILVPVTAPGPLAESLTYLYQGPGERSRLGAAGQHRVKDAFSLDSMVRKYEELYCRLARGQAARSAPAPVLAAGELED
jgi:sugar transferase (PEP-CTERM/EpsH1 system associated)